MRCSNIKHYEAEAIFVFTLIWITACHNISTRPQNNSESDNTEVNNPSTCVRCDKEIIRKLAVVNQASSKFSGIEEFLCSFDPSCDWSEIYPSRQFEYVNLQGDTLIGETLPIRYDAYARQLLMINFYYNFSAYMTQFESNTNLNRDYIFSLMVYENEEDLPYIGILDSLKAYPKESGAKKELLKIFEGNIERFGNRP